MQQKTVQLIKVKQGNENIKKDMIEWCMIDI